MKKYRLKEEAKKYFAKDKRNHEDSLDWWDGIADIEALEEVEERIEIIQLQCTDAKYVTEQILNDRVNLCEKALNGELLDIDSLDDGEFRNFKKRSGDYTHIYNSDLIAYLKQYLKEKK